MATKPNPRMAALLMAAKKKSMTPPMDSQPMMPGQAMPGTPGMMRKGGSVAKKVTKEMEYDYKTGKKSFSGTTAQKDAHAEKEGKIVAKHLAYDKSKKMASGGKASQLNKANGIAVKGKSKGTMISMCGGGMGKKAK